MLIAHHNVEKDNLQIASITYLLHSVDWWNDYQAHKVREKIYNTEIDNLNISLHESTSPALYTQQIFAKYLFLDKDLHDDQFNSDSLNNLKIKAEANQNKTIELEHEVSKNSELILNYELITILMIVAASLAGISEIAKNKLLGYSAFCIGGAGCILFILVQTTVATLPLQSEQPSSNYDEEQLQTMSAMQSISNRSLSMSNSSSSVDYNEMYSYCLKYQKSQTCDSLFQGIDNT
jgi:hypothetical protein